MKKNWMIITLISSALLSGCATSVKCGNENGSSYIDVDGIDVDYRAIEYLCRPQSAVFRGDVV